jgi:hypothetical protein
MSSKKLVSRVLREELDRLRAIGGTSNCGGGEEGIIRGLFYYKGDVLSAETDVLFYHASSLTVMVLLAVVGFLLSVYLP